MKILFVYPNYRGHNMLPTGVALLSAILKKRGHEVALFDATDYPNPEDRECDSDKLKEKNLNARPFDDSLLWKSFKDEDVHSAFARRVREFDPGLLAMSCVEDLFPIGNRLLEEVSRLDIPVIVGGPFSTFAPELALSSPEVDMVCIGDGEDVMALLCDRMERKERYDDIPGLWVKGKSGIKRNPMGPPADINKNPVLDLTIFPEARLYRPMQGKVWRMLPLTTHRGCPYRCTYCCSPSQNDKYRDETGQQFFRKKNISLIRDEIIAFRDEYKAEALYFYADNFLTYADRELDEFVEMYSEFRIPFWCQGRLENLTYDRMKKLVDVGMLRMAFGIEHGNEEFRKRVLQRHVSNKKILESLDIVNSLGIMFSVNNIVGFPHETRQLTFDTIRLNRRIKGADGVNAYSFTAFHGTPLRAVCDKEGFMEPGVIARSTTKMTMLRMPQYPAEQIEGMRRCFVLYVKMPETRWPDIEKAERLTPEGDGLWEDLRQECAEKYMKF